MLEESKTKKYELTSETKAIFGKTLFRIKALVSFGAVRAGDEGGFVEAEKNLSQSGDAWVHGNAEVYGNARVYGDARVCGNGGSVTNISVATSESWKDKQTGQKQERTEWHRIVFFNRLAEIAAQYLRKGSKVYVEGSLRTRKYEKDGQTHYATEIVASELQMLDSRSASDGQQARPAEPAPAPSQGGDFDDGIPF